MKKVDRLIEAARNRQAESGGDKDYIEAAEKELKAARKDLVDFYKRKLGLK